MRISPACALSRRHRRDREPRSRPPCVPTVDFESDAGLTRFRGLCFFPRLFLFILEWKTRRPLSRVCRPMPVLLFLLCPLASEPNMTSCAPPTPTPGALCGIVIEFFFAIGTNQDNPVWRGRGGGENKTGRDCGFKVYSRDSCCVVSARGISWTEVS